MADDLLDQAISVDTLNVEQLLADWRWFCPEAHSLIARNLFGDLFLLNAEGKVLWLQVGTGELTEIATSQSQFHELLKQEENRGEWLAEAEARAAWERGLRPGVAQCVGFKIPIVFSQSGDVQDNAYVADLYEQVSFLGDIHRQIASLPDGSKVRLRILK